MIEKLREYNNKLISLEKDKCKIRRRKLIDGILEDDRAFLKMDIETAYSLLKELDIKDEDLRSTYLSLISADN